MKIRFILVSLSMFLFSCQKKEFKVSTSSMENTLKVGQTVMIKENAAVHINDIIAFQQTNERFEKGIWLFRVIGISGDKIEINKGKVYVNEKPFKENGTLKYGYQLNSIKRFIPNTLKDLEVSSINEQLYIAYLSNQQFNKLEKNSDLLMSSLILQAKRHDPNIFQSTPENEWNTDNFGPLKIPFDEGKKMYFVLGDNRHNAVDSRYLGFIKTSQVLGVIE